MNLPPMRTPILGDTPIIIAPIVKNISAQIIVILRPYLSAKGPAISEPIADPSYARDTIVYNNMNESEYV